MSIQLGQPPSGNYRRKEFFFLAESTVLSLTTPGNKTLHAVAVLGISFPAPGKKGAGWALLGL